MDSFTPASVNSSPVDTSMPSYATGSGTSGNWLSSFGSASSMGSFGTAAQGFGAISSAVGVYYGAQAQKSAIEFQAQTARANAVLAEKSAQSVELQGEAQAHKIQLQTKALVGTQRASMAANGVDLYEGSAGRIQTDTKLLGELDAETAHANAIRAAWGYRTQGTNYSNQALFENAQASGISPFSAGFSSLLGSASTVASSWYRQKKAGT